MASSTRACDGAASFPGKAAMMVDGVSVPNPGKNIYLM
jgi:hypothetical protein